MERADFPIVQMFPRRRRFDVAGSCRNSPPFPKGQPKASPTVRTAKGGGGSRICARPCGASRRLRRRSSRLRGPASSALITELPAAQWPGCASWQASATRCRSPKRAREQQQSHESLTAWPSSRWACALPALWRCGHVLTALSRCDQSIGASASMPTGGPAGANWLSTKPQVPRHGCAPGSSRGRSEAPNAPTQRRSLVAPRGAARWWLRHGTRMPTSHNKRDPIAYAAMSAKSANASKIVRESCLLRVCKAMK